VKARRRRALRRVVAGRAAAAWLRATALPATGGSLAAALPVLVGFLAAALPAAPEPSGRPAGFVDAAAVVPGLAVDMRYAGPENFVGRRVDGYESPRCLLTRPAADALARVQAGLAPFGLGLRVFDCYRPERAVADFVRWAEGPDDATRAAHHPGLTKGALFAQGYVARSSSHSRGSTVDCTLVDTASGRALDMGTPFDFFSERAWPADAAQPAQVRANRLLLRTVMEEAGFSPYAKEWWHFTLAGEPYPETGFDFPVE